MPSSNRPPELQAIFDEIERAGPFSSLEDVNRLLADRMQRYNATAQPALGGLSPDEMGQLLYGDWVTEGALRLDDRLTLPALAAAPALADARTVLDFIASEGPVKETAARNLPRAAVAALHPHLRIPAQRSSLTVPAAPARPLNEDDVPWLPVLRHTLMFAKLLIRRRGLRVTPRGRELAVGDRAGALYSLLFRTLFREVDLRVFGRDGRHAGLQSTVAYSFYRLRTAARDWSTSETLAGAAWLENAKDPPTEWEAANVDFRHYALHHRVLGPLFQFGLLERRVLPTEERWKDLVEFRVTPLFDRFMRFEFRAQAARGVAPRQ